MLLPNELIHKRYRIVSLLGQGPYGAVYRAWDTAGHKSVALKEYSASVPDLPRLFAQQAHRLTTLNHPQLPQVKDYFSQEQHHYLVWEFVEGVSLQELLQQYKALPSEQIVVWLRAAAKPLAYLHQQKQVHGNLKPANIRLTPAGEIFVVDSGLPEIGIPPGTLGYSAPEQQKQVELTPLSDIYSLGATLYTLLTNKVPPDGLRRESGLSTLVSARDANPDVEPYLAIVANRAMGLDPRTRYETVETFAQALQNPLGVAQPTPAGASPRRMAYATPSGVPPKIPQKPRPVISPKTIWGLGVIILLVIITSLTFNLINQQELTGGSAPAATATTQSQIIAALTAVAPTNTPTPLPTLQPTPTPAPLTSKTGMLMVYVPGGVFRLGNDDGNPDQRPSILVNMDPYFMDETEVTNGQYAQCVADGVCRPPSRANASYHPLYYGSPDYDNYPVIFVDWNMADTFCRWRSARLPSEAEWERAAGYNPATLQRTFYPWGDEFNGENLNYCDANCSGEDQDASFNDQHRDTAPVKSYETGRSPLGVYDMLGNVMEWTADWYDRKAYASAPNTNPRGPASGDYKVIRGGSWLSGPDDTSVTYRTFFSPGVVQATLGFRCAADVK